MKKYCVLFNPYSANSSGEKLSHKLDDILSDCELDYQNMDEIKDFKEFFEKTTDDVIICGGDGTINHFINRTNGLTYNNDVLYFPSGTGNDFHNDVGNGNDKPYSIKKYIEHLPVVTVNGKEYKFTSEQVLAQHSSAMIITTEFQLIMANHYEIRNDMNEVVDQVIVYGAKNVVYYGNTTYWAWPTDKPFKIASYYGDIEQYINFREKEKNTKYYETGDRGLYVYLIKNGFTDVYYRKINRNHIFWSWQETEELNKAIADYYEQKQEQINNHEEKDYKQYTIVSRYDLVRDLTEMGYDYVAVEPDLFDYRRQVYLYKKTDEFNRDFAQLLRDYGFWVSDDEWQQLKKNRRVNTRYRYREIVARNY